MTNDLIAYQDDNYLLKLIDLFKVRIEGRRKFYKLFYCDNYFLNLIFGHTNISY